jgi:hypothetical protein
VKLRLKARVEVGFGNVGQEKPMNAFELVRFDFPLRDEAVPNGG